MLVIESKDFLSHLLQELHIFTKIIIKEMKNTFIYLTFIELNAYTIEGLILSDAVHVYLVGVAPHSSNHERIIKVVKICLSYGMKVTTKCELVHSISHSVNLLFRIYLRVLWNMYSMFMLGQTGNDQITSSARNMNLCNRRRSYRYVYQRMSLTLVA